MPHPTHARRLGAPRRSPAVGLAAAVVALATPAIATAAPGIADRLGGIEPQGPATRAVTGLHYNPAMLAAMRSTSLHGSLSLGVAQQRIRRHAIDAATGAPTNQLDDPANLLNVSPGWFVGGVLYLDPWAVGLGVYDLSSRYQFASADPLRYQIAPDPDRCIDATLRQCPPNGGHVSYRHDTTLALAYNGGRFQLGAAAHFPMVRQRFAFDSDTELLRRSDETVGNVCEDKEDPACAERVGFKGWTQWIPRNGAPAGFDVAVSVGVGVALANDRVTIGARYRSFPLRRAGEVRLGGVGLVCKPQLETADLEDPNPVPSCAAPDPVSATLTEKLPQQFAFGVSALLGKHRQWRLDSNFFWADLCSGGLRATECPDSGNQHLRLVGLARAGSVLPEITRHRGLVDVYGADIFAKLRPNVRSLPRRLSRLYVLMGGHLRSPAVRRGATTAAYDEGWRIGGSVGTRLKVRQTELAIVPGYGLDLSIPRRVDPGIARFDPVAATAFLDSGGDLNAPGAETVLDGRGRPTNAGRYFSLVHTLSLSVLWGEAGTTLE